VKPEFDHQIPEFDHEYLILITAPLKPKQEYRVRTGAQYSVCCRPLGQFLEFFYLGNVTE